MAHLQSQPLKFRRQKISTQRRTIRTDNVFAHRIFISDLIIIYQSKVIGIFKQKVGRIRPFIIIRKLPLRKKFLPRSEEHTSELQSRGHLVCRLLLEKKNN